jgi:YHS domain-containing protein
MERAPAEARHVQGIQRFHTICKRVFSADPAYFPRAEYRGKTIYFCTESCLDAFLADPERFYSAHSRSRKR